MTRRAPAPRILILGGTAEARRLAERLVADHGDAIDVITSLAGRTHDAARPPGRGRTGGFGGVDGLVQYLGSEGIDALIDATHPFAAEISAHAAAAAALTGVPSVMLARPAWSLPPALKVHRVSGVDAAASALTAIEATRVLVTIGHRGLEGLRRFDGHLVVRQIEAHEYSPALDNAEHIIDRPPFSKDGELALMRENRIDALLTKESGGPTTVAKLDAACELGIPVIMIERPSMPTGESVVSVDAAIDWIRRTLGI